MNRITIADVARLAKVSKVTVSYVLNGRGEQERISADTSARVVQAARELGYRPNALARMLVTKRTETLAVVFQFGGIFSSWSSFTVEVMRGVCDAAVRDGFDLMLHTKYVGDAESEADGLADGRVDGVLALRDQDDPTLLELMRRRVPVVQFFTQSDDPNACFVDADNHAGGQLATRHLIELGHTRIGMIRGAAKSVSSNERFRGYLDALSEAGIPHDPSLYAINEPWPTRDELKQLMAMPNRPTALFVWADEVAFHCMRELAEFGVRVPKDLSIVSFDSVEACNSTRPALTSVRQPIEDMAREATRILISVAKKQEPAQRQVIYPVTLDVRASTGPPPKS